jgi:hypothetical protein
MTELWFPIVHFALALNENSGVGNVVCLHLMGYFTLTYAVYQSCRGIPRNTKKHQENTVLVTQHFTQENSHFPSHSNQITNLLTLANVRLIATKCEHTTFSSSQYQLRARAKQTTGKQNTITILQCSESPLNGKCGKHRCAELRSSKLPARAKLSGWRKRIIR